MPTNPYAAVSQLSGLAGLTVDAGKKAAPPSGYNRRRLNAINRTEPNRIEPNYNSYEAPSVSFFLELEYLKKVTLYELDRVEDCRFLKLV